jgi:hypothetical protein
LMGFALVMGFIDHLHNSLLHFTNHYRIQTTCFQSFTVYSSRFLVSASNSGGSSVSALTSLPAGSQIHRLNLLFTDSLTTDSSLESELLYDWQFTANAFVLVTSPLRLTTSNFIFQLNTCCYSPYVISSLTRDPESTDAQGESAE